jgi:histidinol phosphatase-like enzyme
MNKSEFIRFVYTVLKENPEWMADTVIAMNQGLVDRVQQEAQQRSKCEASLLIAYEAGKNKIKPHQREMVKEALKTSFNYAETQYANEL